MGGPTQPMPLSMVHQDCTRPWGGEVQPAPVAIFWDLENCGLPSDVPADILALRVRAALKTLPETACSPLTHFSAYGDFSIVPQRTREGCQRTGITLIDVPNGRKDAADKAIMTDMFCFALDHRPPCTLFLISSDVDFAQSLHKLGQRGYSILLAVLGSGNVNKYLTCAADHVWDWATLARGHGLVQYQEPSPDSSLECQGCATSDRHVTHCVKTWTCVSRKPKLSALATQRCKNCGTTEEAAKVHATVDVDVEDWLKDSLRILYG